ncbi:hypothetical protein M758_5G063000 [Ceratodon purpureus]|nr:hypothetical protein M758_5G063000 [Ceratodon purpureus]
MVTKGVLGDDEKQGLPTTFKDGEVVEHERRHWSKVAIVPFLGLTAVQFMYAGHTTLTKVALTGGVDAFLLSFYRNMVAGLFLAPFAFYLERDVRPKMTWATFGKINLLAFYAIVANQLCFLAALALVSPMVLSAVQNMTPICTFLLAALFGTEKMSFRKASDFAKMIGTVICIGGAVTITLYKGVEVFTWTPTNQDIDLHGFQYLFQYLDFSAEALHLNNSYALPLGVLCVLGNCVSWALYLIKQGPVLEKYPALLSMISIMQLVGSLQMAIAGTAYEGTSFLDYRLSTKDQLIVIIYGGTITSGVNLALQSWCVTQVGAFIVSLFNPVQTLIVAFMAILFLGDTLYMGILIGGALIIGGFYIVIYAQQMERRDQKRSYSTNPTGLESHKKQSDLEEPLLA